MRFMMIVKANADSESGMLPSDEMVSKMMDYNTMLAKAGVLVDLNGLQPSSKGARVKFSNGQTTVTDGPFAETKELLAGYWVIRADSLEEAIAWARQIPFDGSPDTIEPEVEVRQIHELEDFASPASIARAKQIEALMVK
ncbi:MAG TPA: YciI family protein [Fimbriimonadaceae bacterium]|nr:YciI family protein [Fimbriimonadaceae bacterium]